MFGGLRFRVWRSSFSCLGVFLFVLWGLRFRVMGSSFSFFGVFVFVFWGLRSSVFVFGVFAFSTTTSAPAYGRTRKSHDFKIRLPSSSVDSYKHSFYVRSIPAWNALPADVVGSASYPEFIRRVSTTLTC